MSISRSGIVAGAFALAMTFGMQAAVAESPSWIKSTVSPNDAKADAVIEPIGQCIQCEPMFSVRLDALFWERENTVFDTTALADVDFDHEVGWNLSGIRRIDECWSLEGRYFQVDSGSSYTTPDNVGDYDSDLLNIEFNLRYRVTNWLQLSGGFRYIALDEAVRFTFGGGTESARFSTQNDLFGGQFGAVAAKSFGRFEVEGVTKVGWFYNRMSGDGSATAFTFPASSGDDLSIALEAGISLAYRITDSLAVRGGYQVLILSDVVTAGAQASNIFPLAGPETLVFKGFFFGAEIQW